MVNWQLPGVSRGTSTAHLHPHGTQPGVFYPALTSLRGIASLWVVVLHSTLVVGALLPGRPHQVWDFFARPGFLGVDVFFVLSGFVLSLGYGSWFENATPHLSSRWLRFVRNRAARIFPAHLAVLFALAAAVWGFHVDLETAGAERRWTAGALVMSLLLVQTWFGRVDAWNAVAWSVSAEWLLYVVFPAIAYSTARAARRWGTRGSGVMWCFALAAIAAIDTLHLRGVIAWQVPVLVTAAIEFGGGALLCQSRSSGGLLPNSWFRAHAGTLLLLLLLFGSAFVASLGWPPHGLIVVIPLIVLTSASEHAPSWLQRKWLHEIGDISYSLYLVHYPWQWLMRTIIPPTDFSTRNVGLRIGVVLLYLIPPFAVASLSHRLIERPAQRILAKRD